MKKFIIFVIAAILLVMLTGCFLFHPGTPHETYQTLEAALRDLRFSCSEPAFLPEGYKRDSIIIWTGNLLEITYKKSGSPMIEFCAIVEHERDVDSFMNHFNFKPDWFPVTAELEINGAAVVAKGKSEEDFKIAAWQTDGISFAVRVGFYDEEGLPLDVISNIIESITDIKNLAD